MRRRSSGGMPWPVSLTVIRISSSVTGRASTSTRPLRSTASSAFDSRLTTIWRSRPGSVTTSPMPGVTFQVTCACFAGATPCTISTASSSRRGSAVGMALRLQRPRRIEIVAHDLADAFDLARRHVEPLAQRRRQLALAQRQLHVAGHRRQRRADLVRELRGELAQRRQPDLRRVVEAHVVEQAVELRQRRVLLGQIVRRRLDLGGEALVERADLRVGLGQPLAACC